MLLLDTTVLIDVLRDRPVRQRVLELQATGQVPFTCAVNVEEVARGLRPEERASCRDLVESLRLAPLGVEEGWRAGQWRQRFATRGVTLSQSDCLIAAAALGVRARLATGNPRHFPMPEIRVEHWEVGA